MLAAWECLSQSCVAADTAGSTSTNLTVCQKEGGDADKKCIARYNPAMAVLISGNVANGPKQSTGISSMLMGGRNSIWRPLTEMFNSTEEGTFTGTCAKNILIFTKGTLKPGPHGIILDHFYVRSALLGGLHTRSATIQTFQAIIVLVSQGMIAKDIINQGAQNAQNQISLSPDTQGAMVARKRVRLGGWDDGCHSEREESDTATTR
jgi:hypothetical protein